MNKQKNSTRFIAYTAMGLALVFVAQLLGKLIGSRVPIYGPFSLTQLISGSLVNCVLLVFTALAGVWSGVIISVLSPVLAFAFGIQPQPFMIPVIALGNAILCLVYVLLAKKLQLPALVAVIAAAVVKCGFFWLTVPHLVKLFVAEGPQLKALPIMFSWPQGVTALLGGLLALVIIKRLQKTEYAK